MPVIGIPVKKLIDLFRAEIGRDELLRSLEQLGSDVEGYTTYRRYACAICGGIMEITETEDVPAV